MTIRLLHIFHAGVHERPGVELGLLRAWIDHSPHRHHVAVVGPTPVVDEARGLELPLTAVFGAPHGLAAMAAPAIARAIRGRRRLAAVVCWSAASLGVVQRIAPRLPAVLCLAAAPSPRAVRGLARSVARGGAAVACFSDTAAEALRLGGVPGGAVHEVPPGIDPIRFEGVDRAALRRGWGVDGEATPVAIPLTTPPMEADAERAAIAFGMAAEAMGNPGSLRQSIRLVCHPMQRHASLARRVLADVEMPDVIVQDARVATPWRVLAGADVALAFGPGGGRLPRAWAMAAGRPLVAAPVGGVADDVRHAEHALIAKTSQPRDLAHCLKQLLEDRAFAAALGERAAARAAERFAPAAMARRLDEIGTRAIAIDAASAAAGTVTTRP